MPRFLHFFDSVMGTRILHPRLLGDPVSRADLQQTIEDFFVENDTGEVGEDIVWDAFKAVVRGRCISAMSHIRRAQRQQRGDLERKLRDAESELARAPT